MSTPEIQFVHLEVSDEDLEFREGDMARIVLDAINCRIGYALQVDHDLSVLPKLLILAKFFTERAGEDTVPTPEGVEAGQVIHRTQA